MTEWFARPVLHVSDVEASLRFYVDRLGFTCLWRHDEDGVAQVDRQGCALILANTWPEKIGKGLMFISLNVEPATREGAIAASHPLSHSVGIAAQSKALLRERILLSA
jgi:catechol 2,3-dioxygenase-like lactoylglutathione lyase family enzyme